MKILFIKNCDICLREHAATNFNICGTEKFALWFCAGNQKFEVFLAYEDHFWGFWRPFWAVLGHFCRVYPKKGISEKNEKFHFSPVRGWGWLRWVALIKILIFRRFQAHLIICLLLKIVGFLPICNRLMGANLSGTDRVKCSFITLGQFFAYKNWFWWP